MKKRFLSLILCLSLILPCLFTPASALDSVGEIISIETGEVIQIGVRDEQGQIQYLNIYDEQGNQLYEQVGEYEWEKLDTPIPAAEVERRREAERAERAAAVAQKNAEFEQVYHVKLDSSLLGDSTAALRWLTQIENSLLSIPAPLRDAVSAQLSKQGKTLSIGSYKKFNETGNGGMYYPGQVRIELAVIYMFGHEYGHLLGETVLPQIYGSNTLKTMWNAQNGGVAYGNYDSESPAFVTGYGATNFSEDFAETFAYTLGMSNDDYIEGIPLAALRLTYDSPDSIAVKKMAYMRQLLCEAFSLDPSIFPNTTPSSPSAWAKEGIEECQSIFSPDGDYGVIPNSGQLFVEGYQTGATRQRFAYSMFNDVVSQLRYNMLLSQDYNKYEEYQEKWRGPDYDNQTEVIRKKTHPIPFTDVELQDPYSSGINPVANAIYILNKNGVVNGTSDTTFNPDGLITRQEAAAMLYRLCKALDYELPQGEANFADADQIAPWAREAVGAIYAAGIMNGVGDNRFDPNGVYTYEQSALTLLRVYKLLAGAMQQ